MGVPSVAVYNVGLGRGLCHLDIFAQVMKHFDVRIAWVFHLGQAGGDALHVHILGSFGLCPKTTDFYLGEFGLLLD